jgi:putative IMPACT (imprinted ancient) family translation regulator
VGRTLHAALYVTADYSLLVPLQRELAKTCRLGEILYAEQARLTVHVPVGEQARVLRAVADLTCGQAAVEDQGTVYL